MKYTKITISGKICSGKTTLFWNLQQRLRWPTFSSSQFFRDLARNQNLSLNKAEEQDEKLTREIDSRIAELLKTNEFLIVEGWMAGIMADKISKVLRVLLICADKVRIKRFSVRENISIKKAGVKLMEREKNWLNKIKKIYGRDDIFDPKYYNCVIDTTNLKSEEILQKIINLLQ